MLLLNAITKLAIPYILIDTHRCTPHLQYIRKLRDVRANRLDDPIDDSKSTGGYVFQMWIPNTQWERLESPFSDVSATLRLRQAS